MLKGRRAAELVVALLCASWCVPALAQSDTPQIALTVAAGRPLDILLDKRVVIKAVGQPVDGVLVQSLYAYDRVVVPAGTRLHGRVQALEPQSKFARVRAMLSGDLTPPRHVVLRFETFEMASGEAAAVAIARQIRQQYTIGYTPTNAALDGTCRAIDVKATARNRSERLTVRTRAGYRAGHASQR
jgi:hypothetical protein